MENTIPEKGPITDDLINRMNRWWRAANYLSACQLYLLDNPLLKRLQSWRVRTKFCTHQDPEERSSDPIGD